MSSLILLFKRLKRLRKKKKNKRTGKIKKMLRCPVVVVTSPRPSGKTTGVEDVDVVAPLHTGWHGGGGG